MRWFLYWVFDGVGLTFAKVLLTEWQCLDGCDWLCVWLWMASVSYTFRPSLTQNALQNAMLTAADGFRTVLYGNRTISWQCRPDRSEWCWQWFCLRPLVLGKDRSETKKKSVLVLQVLCCVVKHNLYTIIVIMIVEDIAAFLVLFFVSLFCAWNITAVESNSGVHLLQVKSAKCLCLLPVYLVLVFRSWSWS